MVAEASVPSSSADRNAWWGNSEMSSASSVVIPEKSAWPGVKAAGAPISESGVVEVALGREREAGQLEVERGRPQQAEHPLQLGAVEAGLDVGEAAGVGHQHDHLELAAEVGQGGGLPPVAPGVEQAGGGGHAHHRDARSWCRRAG